MEQLELSKPNHSLERRRRKSEPKEWKVVSLRECPAPEAMIKMDCPAQAVQYWKQHICTAPEFNADVECVVVLVLNVRLRIKGHYIVSTGTLCEAMAEAREVFRIAIMAAAHGIVLLHNHPSGEPDPSFADRALTRRIREAGEVLRISLCDHVILGHQRHFSFKEAGLLT